jgi:hypothetical protein
MTLTRYNSYEEWEKTLPRSKMAFPPSLFDQIKYYFWRVYTPFHPAVRDLALALGIVKHSGRQECLIGKIAPNQSLEDLVSFLIENGFGNHFVAYVDDGEIIGLRRVENFANQYHLRIFGDGEIRGHYEHTPECHPILHLKHINRKDCSAEYLELLKGKIIPA